MGQRQVLPEPRGHAKCAAAFGQRRYGWAYGVPYYLAAAYTGWSRVYTDNHYTRDVAVGAAVGMVSALVFTGRWSGAAQIMPYAKSGTYGLQIQRDIFRKTPWACSKSMRRRKRTASRIVCPVLTEVSSVSSHPVAASFD